MTPRRPVRPAQLGRDSLDHPAVVGLDVEESLDDIKMVLVGSDGWSDNISRKEVEECVQYWEAHHSHDREWLADRLLRQAVRNAKTAMAARSKLREEPRDKNFVAQMSKREQYALRYFKGADDISLVVGFCER